MAEAVLEPTEDPVVDPLFRLAHHEFAERRVHCAARVRVTGKQERQVDKAQLRHAVGEIARRLVTERDLAVLDQRENILGLLARVPDVEDVFDPDVIAELLFQPVADEFQRLAESRRRGTIATHSNFDWLAHFHLLDSAPYLYCGAQSGQAGPV